MNLCRIEVTKYESAKISKKFLLNVAKYFCLKREKSFEVKCMYVAKGTEYNAKYSEVFINGRITAGLRTVVKVLLIVEVMCDKFFAAFLPL